MIGARRESQRVSLRLTLADRKDSVRPFSEVCEQQEAGGDTDKQPDTGLRGRFDSFENGSGVAAHFDLALNS